MKIFNSKIYGDIQQPESFEELLSLVLNTGIKDSRNVRYWRGQGNIDWRIDSAGYRRLINTSLSSDDYDGYLQDYEISLLEQATHRGYRYQNGRELYDFELLARLQHHGAATRLVDFSKNAMVGLWYGVCENPLQTGLLIGIHTHFVHGQENKMARESYLEIIEGINSTENLYTWEPPSISTRIAAQHSQFLYSKVALEITGSLILPKEENSTFFVALSPNLKVELQRILERIFDIRTLTLFPDIDGFGVANQSLISRWDMDRW